jgi:peptidoglycan/xylan/chitin deacetylase (PgdA/CDA1 family)
MTVAELRELAGTLAIGAHTRNHPSLAMLPPERQREELERSRADLKAWLGVDVQACAYPFGVPGADVSPASRRAALTFRIACLNVAGRFTPDTDPLMVPRCTVPDVDGERFVTWLRSASRQAR